MVDYFLTVKLSSGQVLFLTVKPTHSPKEQKLLVYIGTSGVMTLTPIKKVYVHKIAFIIP
jgi:hypothetical protein